MNKKIIKRVFEALAVLTVLVITVVLCLFVIKLKNEDDLAAFEEYIRALGGWGIFVMLIIQVLQVILAIIPGEPVELAMGAMYGTIGGCLLCLLGIGVGSAAVFLFVKKHGARVVDRFIASDSFNKLKFLKNPTKRDSLLFLLMFIPGTPKDTLTYFGPFTGISFLRFLIISTVARIPSVISSTYIGETFVEGNYIRTVIAFFVVGVVSLLGIFVYNKIIALKNKE